MMVACRQPIHLTEF